jgi:hypothetical protein
MIIDDLIKSLIKDKFVQFRAVLENWIINTSRDNDLWKLNNQVRIKS